MTARGALALGALALILAVTAAWWALALWPLATSAPDWVVRAREVCFGAAPEALPDAGGWILLVGEPIGLLAILLVAWGDALREGLALAAARPVGRALMAGAVLGSALGVAAAARLVAQAQAQPFVVRSADIGVVLASGRVGKKAPPLRLIDQHGDTVNLERFRGRPVIVTFGFGHCTTICPLSVQAARTAVRRLAGRGVALLVVTLDPWRDTPARLPYLAARWELEGDMHVLSGAEAAVERALSAWRVPRARSLATGDITHPALVYVVDSRGELAYALGADPDAVVAAVGMLSSSGETPTLP